MRWNEIHIVEFPIEGITFAKNQFQYEQFVSPKLSIEYVFYAQRGFEHVQQMASFKIPVIQFLNWSSIWI